jgi:hypothetical protein
VADASNTPRLTIDAATGNVGIGTLQPREKLEVDGRIRAGAMTIGAWGPDGTYAAIGVNTIDPNAREHFALVQHTNGTTYLNSASNLTLQFRNSDRVVVGDGEITLTRPLRTAGITVGAWPANGAFSYIGSNRFDQRQAGNYALLIGDGAEPGVTYLNSPSKVGIRIGNDDRIVVDANAVAITRSLRVAGALTPSAGNQPTAGIVFPADPGGGGGDGAWIRYYARAGEATTLEIGTSNDPDDHIALMPQTGNVGIGVIEPTAKLDVAGDTLVRGGLRVAGAVSFDQPLRVAAIVGTGGPLRLVGPEVVVEGAIKTSVLASNTGQIVVAAPLALQSDVAIQGKHALRGNDGWLRLNQEKQFASGTHTPGLFAPDSLNVGGVDGWSNPGAGNITYTGKLNKIDVMPQHAAQLNCCDLYLGGSKTAGRKPTPGRALIDYGDRLVLNYGGDWPFTQIDGRVIVPGVLTPSAGFGDDRGIVFPKDPNGGSGDVAWLQYASRGGEAMVLELGIGNDVDDHISLNPGNGNVGVGTRTPGAKLDVIGVVRCQRLEQTSSRALKKKIKPLGSERAAAIVEGLDPVSFEWKSGEAAEQLGFIAEDCPDAVTTVKHDAITVSHIVAALTRVVRDQTATIAGLQDRLGRMEARA